MSNGERITVDVWAKLRSTDLMVFAQTANHERRLDPEGYTAKRVVEDWDALLMEWLVKTGRVEAPQPVAVAEDINIQHEPLMNGSAVEPAQEAVQPVPEAVELDAAASTHEQPKAAARHKGKGKH